MKYVATIDGQEYHVSPEESGIVMVDGLPYEIDLQSIDGGFHYSLLVGPASHEVFVEQCEDVCFVTIEGHRYQVQVEDERLRRLGERRAEAREGPGEADVASPMPGVVVAVLVQEGQIVKTGQGLAILEAMKMENEIRSSRNGVVEQVAVIPGQRVSQDDVLLRIGALPDLDRDAG
jgi:biotin carboxyl carrier protein